MSIYIIRDNLENMNQMVDWCLNTDDESSFLQQLSQNPVQAFDEIYTYAQNRSYHSLAVPYPEDGQEDFYYQIMDEFGDDVLLDVYFVLSEGQSIFQQDAYRKRIDKYLAENFYEPMEDVMECMSVIDEDVTGSKPMAFACMAKPTAKKNSSMGRFYAQKTMVCEEASTAPSPSMERWLDDIETNESFQDMLLRLIREKDLSIPDIYKRGWIKKATMHKVLNETDMIPKKDTIFQICIGARLSLDETLDLLNAAGYTISHSSKHDIIFEYFLKSGIYDMYTIEDTYLSCNVPGICKV